MAGIYLHIPFCRQACHYCNFHFSTSLLHQNEVIDALLKEVSLQSGYLSGEDISTIYLGGGTPSLLSPGTIETILAQLARLFKIAPGAEITMETNPDDLTYESLRELRTIGINRLSIGIQSFSNEDLKWMNRVHSADQAVQAIEDSKRAGFQNISIDLIYGMPTLSDEQLKKNVEMAVQMDISHVSCYALTVEPKTRLSKMIGEKKVTGPDSDQQARQFLELSRLLEEAGYIHYEISNFSKPGMNSKHNCSYWNGAKYLGLGPSAHSFDGLSRQWNVSNNSRYIEAISNNQVPAEKELLTEVQQLNEYIMTGLRTAVGIDISKIRNRYGEKTALAIENESVIHINRNHMTRSKDWLLLTREGRLFADGIAASMFFDSL